MLLLFKSYISVILLIIITYFIGGFVRLAIEKEPLKLFLCNIFVNILLGGYSLITIFSIITTKGHTIFLIPLIILISISIYYIYNRNTIIIKKYRIISEQITKSSYLLLLFIIPLVFVLREWLCVYNFKDGVIIGKEDDFRTYAEYASNLLIYSCENGSGIKNIFQKCNIGLYHWADIWLGAFVIKFFDMPYQMANDLVAWPFMLTMISMGLLFLDNCNHNNIIRKLIICLLPSFCISALIWRIIYFLFNYTVPFLEFWNRSLYPKDCFAICFIILCLKLLNENKIYHSIISMLCIVPTDVSWLPASFMAAGGLLLYHYLQCKSLKSKEIILELITIISIAILSISLYYSGAENGIKIMSLSVKPEIKSLLKVSTIYILEYSIPLSILIIFLKFLSRKKILKTTYRDLSHLYLVIFLILGGGIAFNILYFRTGHFDSSQFFKLYILSNLFVWIIFISTIPLRNIVSISYYTIGIIGILLVLIHAPLSIMKYQKTLNKHNNEYLEYQNKLINLASSIEKEKGKVYIGVIFNQNNINRKIVYKYPEFISKTPLGGYIKYIDFVSLNEEVMNMEMSPINLFSAQNNISSEEAKIHFCKKYIDIIETSGKVDIPEYLCDQIKFVADDKINNKSLFIVIK